MPILHTYFDTPFGWTRLGFDGDILVSLDLSAVKPKHNTPIKHTAIRDVHQQLHAYFNNPTHKFNIKYRSKGTIFQQRTWQLISEIPCGNVRSYGDLAREINTSALAIGGACKRNPIPLIVPCHRIIAKQGLGGFAGHRQGKMLRIKHWLLQHENAIT